jgi:hypothetical protein
VSEEEPAALFDFAVVVAAETLRKWVVPLQIFTTELLNLYEICI